MARKPQTTPRPKPAPKPAPPKPAARAGRPEYVPTDDHRVVVKMLSAGGVANERIAVVLGINRHTLAKAYKRELAVGQTEIDAQSVNTLLRAMRAGGKESVAAAKWWQQARMGWMERMIVDDGKPAGPMRVIVELVGDPLPVAEPAASAAYGTPRPGAGIVQLVG